MKEKNLNTDCFTRFIAPVKHIALPERFTFPFYYQPHLLSILAAQELQFRLENEVHWEHPFWATAGTATEAIGKMFGVLVVQNAAGELGYLAAFSGKIANENHYPGFVPPVFDVLEEDGFFRKGEAELNAINRKMEALEQDPDFHDINQLFGSETAAAKRELAAEKQRQTTAKNTRDERRQLGAKELSPEAYSALEESLIAESKRDHFILKDLKKHWKERVEKAQFELQQRLDEMNALKAARKTKSAALQQAIFDQYTFLNLAGHRKSLADIFQQNAATLPPAGAGECAAPKLLQYAFLHDLQPIAMAEFWWGESPTGEIRKHQHYYPACRGKCEPILGHMLEGMELDPNPMPGLHTPEGDISILYEDDALLVINKPPTLLSVPGKSVTDSVWFRMKKRYPDATGPLVVHRLDMSTSGLMLIAKTTEVHKALQHQFIKRSVKKRYIALLDGIIEADSGVIDLPLRVDLDDRPRQMVCYEYGKNARTEWTVLARENGRTRVEFRPITGRTHQLRVHAAHPRGLNTPILGDDIYGTSGARLHLHAAHIEFIHPVSGEKMELEVGAEF